MNIFVYSDESGVFDRVHNRYYVFGGVTFLSREDRDICSRRYSSIEKTIRQAEGLDTSCEAKATTITNKSKNKLYHSLNNVHKFGAVIDEDKLLERIFASKKDKQRYLDYAYKIAIKRQFQYLIMKNYINPLEVEYLFFFVDEHTTATNGIYELREALEQEFRLGTYNRDYSSFYPPIFPNLRAVKLEFCNSSSKILIRAADIVANRVYFLANTGQLPSLSTEQLVLTRLPYAY
ncbi:MAG: DUF3800 domain-containing protein [Clostridia bacterium]|nr:DUF3800 domain-containing protein [Clostridia bacterium]